MPAQICAQCRDESNPVTVENGVSIPDADGKVVMVHIQCSNEWILEQYSQSSQFG
jgi:hypothetical protein